MQLLDTAAPLSGAARLWLKNDIDNEEEQFSETIPSKSSDGGHRTTSESASPFPDLSNPQHTKEDFATSPRSSNISPVRRDSISDMPNSDTFSITTASDGVGNQMNALTMDKPPSFSRYSQPFPSATDAPGLSTTQYDGQADSSGEMFTPPWLDPLLAGGTNPTISQQNNDSYQPIPYGSIHTWTGNSGSSMVPQAGSTQQAAREFDSTQFGQWAPPQAGERKLSTATSPLAPNLASMPFSLEANSALEDSGWMSVPSAYSIADTGHRPSTRRFSVSSKTSNGGLSKQSKPPQSQSRERHRLASARNWHKQKQATADLQASKDRAEAQHAALKEVYNDVLNQVQQIKHALMGHVGCNDPAIKMWLERETNKVLSGLQNSLSDGGAEAQGLKSRPASIVDGTEVPYLTPEDDDIATEKKMPRAEGNDILRRGVEVNVRA
ncbi:hypothetical protein VDGL01_11670 [Verticillium dahliae]